MDGLLICMPILVFAAILILVFRGRGNTRKEQLCRKIGTSTDIDYISRYTTGGNYDLNGNHVSYTTISSDEEVKKAANERLIQIAEGTNDPNELLRINSIINLDKSTIEAAAKRMRPEDVLCKIVPKIKLDDSILKNAVEMISDEQILGNAAGNYRLSASIRAAALERITDRDLLYTAAVSHPDDNLYSDRLDEEQKSRFYEERARIYEARCRHGQHNWVIGSQETTHNEESDYRGHDEIRKCRICGRTEMIESSDAYGVRTTVLDPGIYDS
ncbi:MAG: hypothetical protein IKP86_13255 [Anaerolineaceae bacterium]|nr:hypothetical protein [Anaerolineaceae bacterium]